MNKPRPKGRMDGVREERLEGPRKGWNLRRSNGWTKVRKKG